MDQLQPFGFADSEYERPNQEWVCGRTSDGTPCHAGPTARGRCRFQSKVGDEQVRYECIPTSGKGPGSCTRPKILGGKCADGPLPDGSCSRPIPCQPVRNLRSRRGLSAWCACGATLGVLALLMSSAPVRLAFVLPGDLGMHHGALDTGEISPDQLCANCHAAAVGGISEWASGSSQREYAMSQSFLCLNCHNLGDPETAVIAHNLTPNLLANPKSVLASFTGRTGSAPTHEAGAPPTPLALARVFSDGPQIDGRLACATCHAEHRGRHAAAKGLANAQCQICHTAAFRSFSQGHPDVSQAYSFRRVTSLRFDHISHYEGTLTEDDPDQELKCRACHVPDQSGRHMVVADFDTSCAECHADDINTEDDDGILFLTLPRLASRLTPEQRSSLTYWPVNPDGENTLTPFMKALLLGDADYQEGYNIERDLRDWSRANKLPSKIGASEDHVARVERISRAIRSLFTDLSDRSSFGERIARVFGARLEPVELEALVGGSPGYRIVRGGGEHWLNPEKPDDGPSEDAEGHWVREDDSLAITYHPIEHADPFVRAWLDLVRATRHHTARSELLDESTREIQRALGDAESPGACLKCHTSIAVESPRSPRSPILASAPESPHTQRPIHWKPATGVRNQWRLTEFSHAPHLSLIPKCTTCHQQNPTYDRDTFLASYEPAASRVVGGFAPIRRETCTACHTPERAGDSCLQCHKYHGIPPRDRSQPVPHPVAEQKLVNSGILSR